MHEPGDHKEPDVELGFETEEVLTPKSATLFALILAAFVVGVVLIAFWVMRVWGPEDAPAMVSDAVADQRQVELRAAPLQASPEADMEAYEAEQRIATEQYKWIDKERGVVRIPVDRAIDLIIERGLESRGSR